MIRSHIGSTQEYVVIHKLERFSHLLGWSFGLGSLIGLEALSLVLSLKVGTWHERGYLEEGYPVPQRWIRSECYLECGHPVS